MGEFRYPHLDARYETVRRRGVTREAAVLVAVGVGLDGRRRLLGFSGAISEAETHWREFL